MALSYLIANGAYTVTHIKDEVATGCDAGSMVPGTPRDIVATTDDKIKINGNAVLITSIEGWHIEWDIPGYCYANWGGTQHRNTKAGTQGYWKINAASTKCKNDSGNSILRQEDTCQCQGVMWFLWWAHACYCTMYLTSTQTKVKGE